MGKLGAYHSHSPRLTAIIGASPVRTGSDGFGLRPAGEEKSLADRLYDAAVRPESWGEICEELAALAGAFGCAIVSLPPSRRPRLVASAALASFDMDEGLADGAFAKKLSTLPFLFQRDLDLLSAPEREADPFQTQVLRPRGLGGQMGAALTTLFGQRFLLYFVRREEDGGFPSESCEALNLLRQDLERAFSLSALFALGQAQSTVKALQAVGLPAFVLTDDGGVIASNEEAGRVASAVSVRADSRLRLRHTPSQAELEAAIAALGNQRVPGLISIPLPATADGPAYILNLIPTKHRREALFDRSSAILLVSAVGQVGPPDANLLCGLFNITLSEARIASDLARGLTLSESAAKHGPTIASARTYVKRALQKTGTEKQSELVALILSIGFNFRDHL